MKKTLLNLFAIILAVSMVFTMAPLSMDHAYADDTTITIDGVKYTLNDDGTTATVSGHVKGLSGEVIIPSTIKDQQYTITSIGESAFNGCEDLETITIPKGVTSIGEYSFAGSGLISMTFEEGSTLTSIGKSAFKRCKSLETITIPENVTSIGASAFNTCTGLKSITIPKGVTSIGEYSFWESGLTSVTFADESNLTTIEKAAFIYCYSLETITIPESVTSIGESAFYACANLEAINIPAGVESIEQETFRNCASLKTVTIPASVTSIGESAFSGCSSLSTVTIPASVTSIGENAFNYSGLTTVTFEEGSNLTTIEKDTFSDCKSLETITIPTSVQTIESNAFANAPLETIYYLGSKNQWTAIGGAGKPTNATVYYTLVKDGVVYTLNYLGPGGYGDATVSGHTDGLLEKENVNIDYSIRSDNVDYVVRSIGDNAFKDCSSLKTITIPEAVTFIGNGAFDGTSLTTVNFQGTAYGWDAITGAGKPTNVTVIFASIFIDGIEYEPYYGGTVAVKNYTSQLPADVVIPSSFEHNLRQYTVTSIAQDAFNGCDNLESVSIPASVESIGQAAFNDCANLKTVTFEENSKLKSIGERAFYHCTGLLNITIPASVTSIQESAFVDCNALTTFNYLGPKAQWEALNADAGLQVQDGQDIIFKNSDGTELQYSSMKSGLTPQYLGATPTREADNQYTYTFAGWDPEITEVTGTATYTAKYDATRIPTESISIKGAKVALSATTFVYNSKVLKPAIKTIGGKKLTVGTDYTAAWSNASSKNVGTYSVAVTGKGKYKDTAKAAYQIIPKGTSLKKLKKAKKAVTVTWKKQSAKMSAARISGYQIQLATDKTFTKNTKTVNVKGYKKASKKVKKLKGKTKYYVHIRTYMNSGGSTYYSPWSKTKTVKTK